MKIEDQRVVHYKRNLGYEIAARRLVVATGNNASDRFGHARWVSGEGSSVVTDADLANTQLIVPFLRSRYPRHRIRTEETTSASEMFEQAPDPKPTWWIDELDGTRNFLKRRPVWGTAAALRKNGTTIAGAIYLPMLNSEYFASKGNGAFRSQYNNPVPTPLRVSEPEEILTLGVDIQSGRNTRLLDRLTSDITSAGIASRVDHWVTGSSTFDYGMVAQGGYDVHVNRILKGWDIYPGDIIVTEAQGASSQIEDDAVLMSNGHNHDKLVEVIGNVLVEFPKH